MKYKSILIIIFYVSFVSSAIAQAYYNSNRFGTLPDDGWISCTTSPNPNPARGTGHWIMYNLNEPYFLGTSHIWNVNDPTKLNSGIKDIIIDYSENGTTWSELGTYTIPKSTGSLFYQGVPGPHFLGNKMKYVLLTVVNNYGETCFGFSKFKINVLDAALPIELVNFVIECEDKKTNKISWTTNQEFNIDKYVIERSLDGLQWEDINAQEAIGSESQKTNYSITDVVDQLSYYRLRIIDRNDHISYSEIISSNCHQQQSDLTISPNPVTDYTSISFNTSGSTNYTYFVYNALGKLITKKQVNTNTESVQFKLNTKSYSPGEYFVHIQFDNNLLVEKLIVL